MHDFGGVGRQGSALFPILSRDHVEDVLQLGGDFILSSDRRLVYAHRSNDPADRPTARDLVKQIQQIMFGDRAMPLPEIAK